MHYTHHIQPSPSTLFRPTFQSKLDMARTYVPALLQRAVPWLPLITAAIFSVALWQHGYMLERIEDDEGVVVEARKGTEEIWYDRAAEEGEWAASR